MRRPLTLPILLLALAALNSTASAEALKIKVAEEGWAAVQSEGFPTDLSDASPTRNGFIVLGSYAPGARIFLFNEKRNLGIVRPRESRTAGDPVRAEDATYVLNVNVSLTEGKGGSPTPYNGEAGAELRDRDRTQSERTTDGTLAFRWVRIGDARIQVTTRRADNQSLTIGQKLSIEANGLSGYTVDVGMNPGEGTTTGNPTTGGTATGTGPGSSNGATVATPAPPPPSTGGTIAGNLLSLLIGLGVVGGLAFGAWRYARANPEKVSDALGKIGADVPKPLDPDDPPPTTPSATPAPAPVPSGPIVLDPAPVPITVPAAPISLTSAATGIPKLIGSDGSAFELPEGETVVGREALGGLMISHDTVSRRHARLLRAGPSVTVEDLGSTNGTWVNDAPAPATLQGGESVRFGQVAYRYEA